MNRRVLLLTGLVAAACSHPASRGPRPVAIVGAKLVPGEGKPVIEYSIVIIERGRFVAVGPQSSVPMPKEAEIINGMGHTIVPAGNPIEPGQFANLDLKGARGRAMRGGLWQ